MSIEFRSDYLKPRLEVIKFSNEIPATTVIQDMSRMAQDGLSFQWSKAELVVPASPLTLDIIISPDPDSDVHIRGTSFATVDLGMYLRLYENPVYTGGAPSDLPPSSYNRRDPVPTATLSIIEGATVTDPGELLSSRLLPDVGRLVGNILMTESSEFIMNPDMDYLLQVEMLAASAGETSIGLAWYENTYFQPE